MRNTYVIGGLLAAASLLPASAFAQATASEARAMLDKAVAAVKADKAKAIGMFNSGEGGFKDRDLYPFCFNAGDGKFVANSNSPQVIGQDVRSLKDTSGKSFGEEVYAAAQKPEGQVSEVNVLFPKPGPDRTPVPKVVFVTRVGDLGCGAGYYK